MSEFYLSILLVRSRKSGVLGMELRGEFIGNMSIITFTSMCHGVRYNHIRYPPF